MNSLKAATDNMFIHMTVASEGMASVYLTLHKKDYKPHQ